MGHEIRNDKELIAASKALLNWLQSQGFPYIDAVQVMAGAMASMEGDSRDKGFPNILLPMFLESFLTFNDAIRDGTNATRS